LKKLPNLPKNWKN